MRRKYTDTEGWLWITFFHVARHRKAWCWGMKEWSFGFYYDWYDGPIWRLDIGPFYVAIGCWY